MKNAEKSWTPLHSCFRLAKKASRRQKIQRRPSYLSDPTLLWNEEPSVRVCESPKQREALFRGARKT